LIGTVFGEQATFKEPSREKGAYTLLKDKKILKAETSHQPQAVEKNMPEVWVV